jgi:Fe-S oxidoreductase
MNRFDFGGYFGPIAPLADALRESPDRFWDPTPEQLAQAHEYVLYLGCNVLRTMHLAESLVEVLKAMKIDFIAVGGSAHCCGAVHQAVGEPGAGLKIAQKTLNLFGRSHPKAVLTYCPTCNTVFDGKLASGELRCDVPYMHVTQFLAEHLDQLQFARPILRKVALHAHQGTARAKRDSAHVLSILRAIPGLDVVELPAGEEWGYICSPMIIENLGPERHHAMVAAMFAAAKDSGCDAVVTVYHTCYRELLCAEREFGLEWLNYTELLADSLGLGPFPPRYKEMVLAANPDAAYVALESRAIERGGNQASLRKAVDVHFRLNASPVSLRKP